MSPNLNDLAAYLDRACDYISQGLTEQAIGDCNRAIAIDPQSNDAYRIRGIAYFNFRLYDELISDLSMAIQLCSEDATEHSMLASAHLNTGDSSLVGEYSNYAMQFKPEDGNAYCTRS